MSSTKEEIIKLNKSFQSGVLPNSLNFSVANTDEIDFEKIRYNSFYKSFEFSESKFPAGHESIPGMDKIIELCQSELSPLEEMNLRHLDALGNIPSDK